MLRNYTVFSCKRLLSTLKNSSNKTKIKTSKERKDYFTRITSWKANDTFQKENTDAKVARLPKKKVAVMIGFNGSRYQGMQL
jgi:tRNA pseudouridine38-40 synthase